MRVVGHRWEPAHPHHLANEGLWALAVVSKDAAALVKSVWGPALVDAGKGVKALTVKSRWGLIGPHYGWQHKEDEQLQKGKKEKQQYNFIKFLETMSFWVEPYRLPCHINDIRP